MHPNIIVETFNPEFPKRTESITRVRQKEIVYIIAWGSLSPTIPYLGEQAVCDKPR